MKKLVLAIVLFAGAFSAQAQSSAGALFEKDVKVFDFTFNARRLEMGLTAGQSAAFSDYARFGMGAYILANGIYLDFLRAEPQHRYDGRVSDTKWNDNQSFCINAGFQVPIFRWLRLMPLVGYAQTNDGLTDGSTIIESADAESTTWYHKYSVTPGSRNHYFNFGGGLSVQPCKWFSIHFVMSRHAIYGGIGLDIVSIAQYR